MLAQLLLDIVRVQKESEAECFEQLLLDLVCVQLFDDDNVLFGFGAHPLVQHHHPCNSTHKYCAESLLFLLQFYYINCRIISVPLVSSPRNSTLALCPVDLNFPYISSLSQVFNSLFCRPYVNELSIIQ